MPGATTYVMRFGRSQPADAAFFAWTSGDVAAMSAALSARTNLVDRHHLLGTLVRQLYRRRSEPGMHDRLLRVGAAHIAELPTLLCALELDRRAGRLARSAAAAKRNGVVPAPTPAQASAGTDAAETYRHPHVETFILMTRALCEVERYGDAKAVWIAAGEMGYADADQVAHQLLGVDKRHRHRAHRGGA